jgi:hypothetical protein
MRAPKTICEYFDNVRFGIMDIASVKVTLAGNWAAVRRAIASGIGGPCAAFAKTNNVSSGDTLAFRFFSPGKLAEFRKPRGIRFGSDGHLYCDARDEVVAFDFTTGACLGAPVQLQRLNGQALAFFA